MHSYLFPASRVENPTTIPGGVGARRVNFAGKHPKAIHEPQTQIIGVAEEA